MNGLQKIEMLLRMLAEQSGDKVSPQRLLFVAERLMPLGSAEVCDALVKLVDSSRRFPTVEEVRAAMGRATATPREVGTRIANLIIDAVRRYGETGSANTVAGIEAALGPEAWHVVRCFGGWNAVVEQAGCGELNVFRAQVRDYAEGAMRDGQIRGEQLPVGLPALSEVAAAPTTPHVLPPEKRVLLIAKREEIGRLRDGVVAGEIREADVPALVTAIDRKYDSLEAKP